MKKLHKLLLLFAASIILISFTAATTGTEWDTQKINLQGKKFYIDIPTGSKKRAFDDMTKMPKVNMFKYEFEYKDSLLLYIQMGNNRKTPNASHYNSIGWTADKAKASDTTISGIQSDGTLWKEIYQNDVILGYKNVPASEKEVYDRALNSFRNKKKLK